MKRIYIISDCHWNHRHLVTTGIRPEGYEQKVAAEIAKLGPDDTLIDLGDTIFAAAPQLRQYLDSPCRKILCRGNHDHQSYNWYVSRGYAFACEALVLEFQGQRITFSHKPVPIPLDVRGINIHGHHHQGDHRSYPEGEYHPGKKHFLFTLEGLYKPVELSRFLHQTGAFTAPVIAKGGSDGL